MATLKHSRQRDAIQAFLMTRKDHPTAETVYAHVCKDFPNISLGTVYRNLSLLVETGQAIKVPCEDGSVHFDGNTAPHYHFQCTGCNAILDIDFKDPELESAMLTRASQSFPGQIRGHVTFFYGLCPACARGKSEKK